jgi:signal transduction histidine kinase
MKLSAPWRTATRAYPILAALVLASAAVAVVLDYSTFGEQFDKYAYDFLFRLEPPAPWTPSCIILAIDEQTLAKYGGNDGRRAAIADGLEKIAASHPRAVAVDVILDDRGPSEEDDRKLEQAFSDTPHLILASYLLPNGAWTNPLPRFRKYAAAVAQVHADFDRYDAVSRDLPLATAGGTERRWALSFDAYLMAGGLRVDEESPDDLLTGSVRIPTTDREGHVIRIRYAPTAIPKVSIAELDADPGRAAQFAGKVVFVGETVQAAGDSWMTPYSNSRAVPGVEIHANAYETLARHMFLADAPLTAVLAFCFALASVTGLIYAFGSGWQTNLAAAGVALVSQAVPVIAFARSTVWPWLPGTLTAAFAITAGAAWRHLAVRRQLVRSEGEKDRYQRAMQFVTHEMRTPLTAIQGSSELISRYATTMPEAKRTQIADMINSESKRLARMIETFLSVERLSAGQMELKQERFPLAELVERCAERARPFAERKRIRIDVETLPPEEMVGDRELMEYAVYNLLTNAVKYSPPETRVRVFGEDDKGDSVRLSIEDHGIGMDKKEVGRIFEKFYRTKRAEQSGEAGTGIGLSIVEQIVTQHGGSIHVESEPGKGSKFSLILKRNHV